MRRVGCAPVAAGVQSAGNAARESGAVRLRAMGSCRPALRRGMALLLHDDLRAFFGSYRETVIAIGISDS